MQLTSSALGQPYLVSLQNTETLDSFMTYDLNYPSDQQVKQRITNSFSIGNFSGFVGDFSKKNLQRLKRCPLVMQVVPDTPFVAYDIQIQENAPRHLARISRRRRMRPGRIYPYVYKPEYIGEGVNAYVIDSGVAVNHPEFEGRAKPGKDFTEEGSGDTNGHGSHVAGLIGSKTYGVAKGVEIIEVKALNSKGTGSLSTILAAIEFAVNHRTQSGKQGVVNLSLGSYKNQVLNLVIEEAVKTGLIVVVAAGNSNTDACLASPASSPAAITVGAIDDTYDTLTSFSNWGECVDIFASGSGVESVNIHNSSQPSTLSGTSMAAPIVSGLVANLLSEGIPPDKIKETLLKRSVKNRMHLSSLLYRRKTPNRIAYNAI
ncbi:uncharacterized protein J8A68_003294 [[Candida] subhashii]|uniref:Peptidase S8/S53 domain-containing protein n=1 Tax=[Candida] subhashii TaxID=561895 RepID=A0A8J5UMP3_9ASCO|nr:uncharacterized protein J8A68_003294 [[Candida] subhashii]KAG7663212.1 hypothetical protein J8A68_003294 [[Candida] subhashii]